MSSSKSQRQLKSAKVLEFAESLGVSDDKSKFLEHFKDPSTQSHAAELFAGLGFLAPEEALSFSAEFLARFLPFFVKAFISLEPSTPNPLHHDWKDLYEIIFCSFSHSPILSPYLVSYAREDPDALNLFLPAVGWLFCDYPPFSSLSNPESVEENLARFSGRGSVLRSLLLSRPQQELRDLVHDDPFSQDHLVRWEEYQQDEAAKISLEKLPAELTTFVQQYIDAHLDLALVLKMLAFIPSPPPTLVKDYLTTFGFEDTWRYCSGRLFGECKAIEKGKSMLACTKCKNVLYCSPDHQKAHRLRDHHVVCFKREW